MHAGVVTVAPDLRLHFQKGHRTTRGGPRRPTSSQVLVGAGAPLSIVRPDCVFRERGCTMLYKTLKVGLSMTRQQLLAGAPSIRAGSASKSSSIINHSPNYQITRTS